MADHPVAGAGRSSVRISAPAMFSVGSLTWPGRSDRLTIIAKSTHAFSTTDVVPNPLPLIEARPWPGGGDTLACASDWIPFKRDAELLITGHARSAKPRRSWPIGITAGAFHRTAFVVTDEPVNRCALVSPFVRTGPRAHDPADRVGPAPLTTPHAGQPPSYQSAPACQHMPSLPLGEVLIATGLMMGGEPHYAMLPSHLPWLDRVVGARTVETLEMRLDTIVVHADEEVLTLTYRALIAHPREDELLVVGSDPASRERAVRDALEERAREDESLEVTVAGEDPLEHTVAIGTPPEAPRSALPFVPKSAVPLREMSQTVRVTRPAILDSAPSSSKPQIHASFGQTQDISDTIRAIDALPFGPRKPTAPASPVGTDFVQEGNASQNVAPVSPPARITAEIGPVAHDPVQNGEKDRAGPSRATWTRDRNGLLPVAAYAQLKVRMLRGDEDTRAILENNGLTLEAWNDEEKARAKHVQRATDRGDGGPAEELRRALRNAAEMLEALDDSDSADDELTNLDDES